MRPSSEARDIVPNEDEKDAGRPQTRRDAIDDCSVAGTKLMSAAASPGRTWSIIVHHRMPALAAAASAALFHGGDSFPCLPDLADPHPSAQATQINGQGGSGRE